MLLFSLELNINSDTMFILPENSTEKIFIFCKYLQTYAYLSCTRK